jgi:hypothetical protein
MTSWHSAVYLLAIHSQKAIFKIKSSKIKCFLRFLTAKFDQNLRKTSRFLLMVQVYSQKYKNNF